MGRLAGLIDTRILLVTGFGLLSLSGFMLGHVNLDVAKVTVIWPAIISGAGTAALFVPLATSAMGTLRSEQIGNASGLFNLMRNLGGSVGISMVTTLLERKAQVHQASLVQHLTPYDPAMQQWLETAQAALARQSGAVTGAQQAWAALYATLVKQAMLLAFVDVFRLLGMLCLFALPAVMLMRRARPQGVVMVH